MAIDFDPERDQATDPGIDDRDFPERWVAPLGPRVPMYVTVHGAYHLLSRRVSAQTAPLGISATEAVVLVAVRREPGAAMAVIRHATGLRASTLTSIVDRLARTDLVRRVRSDADHRYVGLELTARGRISAEEAEDALATVEAELGVFVPPSAIATLGSVFESARALGLPAIPPDY